MNKNEVERYFKEYILPPKGFIFNDIKREIDLAKAGKNGGNFLASLGLLCYTEFMGKIMLQGKSKGRCKKSKYQFWFETFLRCMGQPYADLLDKQGLDVWHDFRCEMAHSYFAHTCVIAMLDNGQTSGIGIRSDGKHFFSVEKYFNDFNGACYQLYTRLTASNNIVWLQST